MTVYTYQANANDRLQGENQIEFIRENGTRAILVRGLAYDITASEYAYLRRFVQLVAGGSPVYQPLSVPNSAEVDSIIAQVLAQTPHLSSLPDDQGKAIDVFTGGPLALTTAATRAQKTLAMAPWKPTPTEVRVVNSETAQWGVTWAANPDFIYWKGKFALIYDQNRAGGINELDIGQNIALATCTDPVDPLTYVDEGEIFTDAAKCNNPLPANYHIQPSIFAPHGDNGPLWAVWNRGNTIYLAFINAWGDKWTIRRMMWRNQTDPEIWAGSDITSGTVDTNLYDLASFDGISDLTMFCGSRPIITSKGLWVIPLTLMSQATLDPAVTATNVFYKQWKYSTALISEDDGATWRKMDMVPNVSLTTPGNHWEQYVWESEAGHLWLAFRNLSFTTTDDKAQIITVSRDFQSWDAPHASERTVTSQRANAMRDPGFPDRWYWGHVDHGYGANGTSSITGRFNGTLWVSRRGIDDFIAGIPLTQLKFNVVYPQVFIKDGVAYFAYCSDQSGRRSMWMAKAALPTDGKVYAYPRRLSEMSNAGPIRHATAPAYLEFTGSKRATGSANWRPTGDFSLAAYARLTGTTGIIFDNRSGNNGVLMQGASVSLRSLQFNHGIALAAGDIALFGATVTLAARKIRQFVRNGSGTLQFKDNFVRCVAFSGQPADGATIAIDGTTFTFKNTPSAGTDVQIGASTSATANNFATILTNNAHRSTSFNSTEVMISRTADGADFTAANSSDGVVTVSAGIPTTFMSGANPPEFGMSPIGTSVQPGVFDLFEGWGFSKALSDAEIKFLGDTWSTALGFPALGGGSDPGATDWDLKETSTTATWPNMDDPIQGSVAVSGNIVTISGEGSAGIEIPFDSSAITIRYKLNAPPTGSKKYVIATIGASITALRLHISGANPNTLMLDTTVIMTVTDPTQWNGIQITVTDTTIQVGEVTVARNSEHVFGKGPRVAIGSAYPEGLLSASTDSTQFDLSKMHVASVGDKVPTPFTLTASPAFSSIEMDASAASSGASASVIVAFLKRIINGVIEAANRLEIHGDGSLWWGDGTNPVESSLLRGAANQLQSNSEFKSLKASANSPAFSASDSADTATRLVTTSRGETTIGDGTNARDVKVYRGSADIFKTDDRFQAVDGLLGKTGDTTGLNDTQIDALFTATATMSNGTQLVDTTNHQFQFRTNGVWRKVQTNLSFSTFTITPTTTNGSAALTIKRSAEAVGRLVVADDGSLNFSDGTNAADAKIKRLAANQLLFDITEFKVQRAASSDTACTTIVSTGDTTPRFLSRVDGQFNWGSGTSARDVNLYRNAAADRLKTDDHLACALGVATMNGNTTGLTTSQVDALWAAAPPSDTLLNDSTNHILLKRDGTAWYKSAAYTAV